MSELSFYRSLLFLLIAAGLWHVLTAPPANPPETPITQDRLVPANLQLVQQPSPLPMPARIATSGARYEFTPLSPAGNHPPQVGNAVGSDSPGVREIMEIQRRLGGSQVGKILDEIRLPGDGIGDRSSQAYEMAFRDALAQLPAGSELAHHTIERLRAYSRQLQPRDEKLSAAYQRLAEDLSDLRRVVATARTSRRPAPIRQPASAQSSRLR